ncbi:MAG: 5-nucleotidase [Myxococcaceae bacterium]|jgi:hypothetical protein|nr:5-nucleotidase [Myxococcaceae bacterium]MEA2750209.1 hypothetical protein [Myxococcales bacterium]
MTVRCLALVAIAPFAVACGTLLAITPDSTGTTTDGGEGSDGTTDGTSGGSTSDAPGDAVVDHASEGATEGGGDACAARDCNIGTCVAGDCERLVFVTSAAYAIGGSNIPRSLSDADAICQNIAVGRGLKNTFRAWMSDSSQYPADGTRFTQSTRPYRLTNGTMIASSFGGLLGGTLMAPIDVDVSGIVLVGAFAWTGTRADGQRAPNASCTSWSDESVGTAAYAGDVSSTTTTWTEQSLPCNGMGHLYCFEQ